MAELYAAGGMEDEGEDGFIDEEKPTWDDDIDITDIVPSEANADTKKKKKKKKKKSDDDDMDDGAVNIDEMDADVEMPAMSAGDEDWDGTEEMRKRVLEKYMDEVYGLDFNDMVRPSFPFFTHIASNNSAGALTDCRHADALQVHPRRFPDLRPLPCRNSPRI